MATRSLSQENTRVALYSRVSTKDKGQEVENQCVGQQGYSYLRRATEETRPGTLHVRCEHFRESTNQHAIPNRRTSAKEKEILLMWCTTIWQTTGGTYLPSIVIVALVEHGAPVGCSARAALQTPRGVR
jgi:hypothetical protein